MSVRRDRAAKARHRKIESLLKAMQPVRGGLWLAFDRSTGFHWVLDAADVRLVPGCRYGTLTPGSVGVVTVRSRSGEAVFQIEEEDTLVWERPESFLRIQEGGFRGTEIVLERIGDLDQPLLPVERIRQLVAQGQLLRAIGVGEHQYVTLPASELSSGNVEVDATLALIEGTLRSCCAERAASCSGDMLYRISLELDAAARNPAVRSYVWLTALRQYVTLASQTLAG